MQYSVVGLLCRSQAARPGDSQVHGRNGHGDLPREGAWRPGGIKDGAKWTGWQVGMASCSSPWVPLSPFGLAFPLGSLSSSFLCSSLHHSCFGSHHSDGYAERRAWVLAPYPRGFLKEAAGILRVKAVFGDGCGACWYAEQQQGPLQDPGEERVFSVHLLCPMPARRCLGPEKRGGLVLCCPSNDERHLHGDVLPLWV